MSFVVDASMAAAWVLPDEQAEPTDVVMLRLEVEHARAPSLFWHEARSLLLAAERKKRLRPGEASAFMQRLWRLPIEDAGHGSDAAIFALAIRYGLSTYDATYLALAVADQSSLANPRREACRRRPRRSTPGDWTTFRPIIHPEIRWLPCCRRNEWRAQAVEYWTPTNQESIDPLLGEAREHLIDLTIAPGVQHLNLPPNC